ncbi:hypothetical protein N7U66_14995 [Lacinutrix neustonica]|uniref:Peptidase M56 domain-containing protein n=1 Tax=Lacinutrix neustonica TaxID=2980107 RepID=A0A9E8MU28_9FLAO|nr:M56 family metallopeptidase [Lacinutrix neustonica]WAC01361.1 hypothetical protein N7U66_14995 [Lacinutrix neustonica]
MLLILLKSTACLAIFIVFYKLLLEREKMHHFKRYYLLAALVVSFAIPFITFIKYVEPTIAFSYFQVDNSLALNLEPVDAPVEAPINYLPTLLWSLYGLGALLFGIKFGINLFRIFSKINKNEKQNHGNFITVLLQDLVSPHTFFSYIFLNKIKFKTNAIPQEVLLHEATHAKQKHSLDVLFIELLQVLFWFNPLLYYIKKDIKLNHEFLADEAVLKQGTDSSTYQNMLLAFSSHATEPELANAINYSLIKKRFTIMKTKTSRKAIWLRSLLLLPLLGGLLFSFSSTKEVEKHVLPEVNYSIPTLELQQNPLHLILNGNQTTLSRLHDDFKTITQGKKSDLKIEAKGAVDFSLLKNIMTIISKDYLLKIKLSEQAYIENKTEYSNSASQELLLTINGVVCDQCELNLSKKGIEALRLSTTTGEKIISFTFQYPGKSPVSVKGHALNTAAKTILQGVALGTVIQLLDITTENNSMLSPITMKLVDKNNPNYSNSPIVKPGDKSTLPPPPPPPAPINEYKAMKAKANSNLPPPPPPPTKTPQYKKGKKLTLNEIIKKTPKGVESGYEMLKNGESHYFTVHNGEKTYYNKDGFVTDNNGTILPPPPPPAPKVIKGKASNIPPPPAPPQPISTKKHIENMAAKNADFFYNNDPISSKEALKLVKSNSNINISTQTNNGTSTVHLSTKPITVINGQAAIHDHQAKAIESQKLAMVAHEKAMKENKSRHKKARKEALEAQRLAMIHLKKARAEQTRLMKTHKQALEQRKLALEERHQMMQQNRKPLAEQFVGMEANGSAFFYEGEKISEEKAIALIKDHPKLNVSMSTINGKSTVHLSKKGMKTVNGSLVD